jgi:hypothetical protein
MGARQARHGDAHDVIVNTSHALVFQGVYGRSVVNRGHDHRGRETSHVLFPLFRTGEDSIREQDGFCRLYGVKRLGSRLVQAFVSRPAHPSPTIGEDQPRPKTRCNSVRYVLEKGLLTMTHIGGS